MPLSYYKVGFCSQICVLQNNRKASSIPVSYEPSCVSIGGDGAYVAVGGTADNKVCLKCATIINVLFLVF